MKNLDEKLKTIREEFEEKLRFNTTDYFTGVPKRRTKIVRIDIDDLFDIVESHIRRLLEEQQKSYNHKLGMIALGILMFKESEKERDEEEIRGLRRRDGGPAVAAISFLNRLLKEINLIIDPTPATDKLQISK